MEVVAQQVDDHVAECARNYKAVDDRLERMEKASERRMERMERVSIGFAGALILTLTSSCIGLGIQVFRLSTEHPVATASITETVARPVGKK